MSIDNLLPPVNQMTKKLAAKLKEKNIHMAPVDEGTVKKIKKISKVTNSNSLSVINTAIQVLEKALGREVVLKSDDEDFEFSINHFRKYQKVSKLVKDGE